MKIIKIAALSLCAVLLMSFAISVPAQEAGKNLFLNSGFENVPETGAEVTVHTVISDWLVWAGESETLTDIFKYSTTEKNSGERSLEYRGTSVVSRGIAQSAALSEADANKTFSISFYAKNVNSSRAKAIAEVYDYDETGVASVTEKVEMTIKANNEWKQFVLYIKTGAKPQKIKLSILQNGTDGDVAADSTVMYVDDVILVEGELPKPKSKINVINAGFEESATGTDGYGVVPGWFGWAGETLTDIFKYSTAEKISGTQSLEYRGTAVVSRGLQQDISLSEAEANKTFRVSFYAKNVNSTRASFKFERYNYDETGVAAVAETVSKAITPNNAWTHYAFLIQSGAKPQKFRLQLLQNGTDGTPAVDSTVMYVDDIAIAEVEIGENQFENGSLEDTYLENGAIRPYGAFPGSAGFTVGKSYAYDGNVGMHVDSAAAYMRNVIETNNVNGFGTFKAGDAVTISWDLKSNTETRYQVMCCAGPNEGNRIAGTGSWVNSGNGMIYRATTGDLWTKQAYTFIVPEGCTYIKFVFFTMQDGKSPQSGYADYDNFCFKKAESGITYTYQKSGFGEKELTALSTGVVKASATYIGAAEDTPMLVSVLYKTENEKTSIEKMEMVQMEGTTKVKTATIDTIAVPEDDIANIDLYSIKTFVWNQGTVTPAFDMAVLTYPEV